MRRRTFLVGIGVIAGGGKMAYDRFWPEYPDVGTDDIEIKDVGFEVTTPPETDESGSGHAYAHIRNDSDFPITASITFELLKDGNPYTYSHDHEEAEIELQPGEDGVVVEEWSVSNFPESNEATGVDIAEIDLEHADAGILPEGEE